MAQDKGHVVLGKAEPLARLAMIARCVGGKNSGYHSDRADSMSTVRA